MPALRPGAQIKPLLKILGLASASALLLAACGRSDPAAVPSTVLLRDLSKHPIYSRYDFGGSQGVVRLGTQPLYLPTGMIVEAIKRDRTLRGRLRRLGKRLVPFHFLKGNDVNFFLLRGELDAGIGGDMPALISASRQATSVVSLFQFGPTSIVTKKILLLKELRGKRIGYALGSNAHFSLISMLAGSGLSPGDVRLVPMEIHRMEEALGNDRIDAFSGWEPAVEVSLKNNGYRALHRKLSSGFLYFSRAYAEENPDAVNELAAAEIRAIFWLRKNSDNMLRAARWALSAQLEFTGKKCKLTAQELAAVAARDLLGNSSLPNPSIPEFLLESDGLLEREFYFLKSLQMIPPAADWKSVRDSFRPEIVDSILAKGADFALNAFAYTAAPLPTETRNLN